MGNWISKSEFPHDSRVTEVTESLSKRCGNIGWALQSREIAKGSCLAQAEAQGV